jgi:hypothetical protein
VNPVSSDRLLITRYCVTCHNDTLRTAGLTLQQVDVDDVGKHAAVWEKVVRKLRTGQMPPPGLPRPDEATYHAFVTHVETSLDGAAAANPDPGRRPAFHRLNRAEYTNAVRDLLAVDVDSPFPVDDGATALITSLTWFPCLPGGLRATYRRLQQSVALPWEIRPLGRS